MAKGTSSKDVQALTRTLDVCQRRYNALVEAQAGIVCLWLPDTTLTCANAAYARLLGREGQDVTGLKWIDLSEDKDAARAHVDQVLSAGTVQSRVLCHRGRWLDWSDYPLTDESGQVVEIQSVARDMTPLFEHAASLAASEERFRKIVESSPVGIAVYSRPGDLLLVNPALCEQFGIPDMKAVRHLNLFEAPYIDEDTRDELVAGRTIRREVAFNFDTIAGQKMFETSRRGMAYFLAAVTPLNWDHQAEDRSYLLQIQEITARRLAEKTLAESEERLRHIVWNMPVMMDAFDETGTAVLWNRECERVTGYKAEEILGNPDAIRLLMPDPDYRAQMMKALLESGNHYRDWEWQIMCKDGSKKVVAWTNISADFPIPGWSGWGIGVDVTERRRVEEILREKEKELRRQARRLEEANTAMRVLLEHREREKQEQEKNMLASLRTLVLPYVDKLAATGLDDHQGVYLSMIRGNIETVASPLARILSVPETRLSPAEVEVADLVRAGRSSKEIASLLHLSVETVSFYRKSIRSKLGITNKKINLRNYLRLVHARRSHDGP